MNPHNSLTRTPTHLLLTTLSIVCLLVSTSAAVPVASAQNSTQPFAVTQEGQCFVITTLGDGSKTVENFYDYRSTQTDPSGLYSSYGTKNLQQNQVSQVFVYHGRNGTSLVFLHDKFGTKAGGFVATADISGLPPSGEWAVRDDHYDGNQDDVFNTNLSNGRQAHIEWLSNSNRTDGAAFRGLSRPDFSAIRIDLKFNNQTTNYPFEKWTGQPKDNEIKKWIALSGTGSRTQLSMSQPITIREGSCDSQDSTTAQSNTPVPVDSPTRTERQQLFGVNSSKGSKSDATPTAKELFGSASQPQSTTTAAITTVDTPTSPPSRTTLPSPTTQPTATTTSTTADTTKTSTPTESTSLTSTPRNASETGTSSMFGLGFGALIALLAIVALTGIASLRKYQR